MQRFEVTAQLGDGTYGSVMKATDNKTGEEVSPPETFFQELKQHRCNCLHRIPYCDYPL